MSEKAVSREEFHTARVRLFSVLREKVGRASLPVEMKEPMTGAALLDRLSEEHEVIGAYRSVLRLAVEEQYVSETTTISPGDEVALITPVSGG